jgi:type VI secretion system protein VasD
MTVWRRTVLQGLGLAAATLAAACTVIQEQAPIDLVLNADQGINPNQKGTPSPVVVRIYELKGLTAFNAASYFDLSDNEAKALGPDLIASHEYELTPGQSQKFDSKISSQAAYVGVIAGFRDIQSARWRDSIALDKDDKRDFVISLTSMSIRIQRLADAKGGG